MVNVIPGPNGLSLESILELTEGQAKKCKENKKVVSNIEKDLHTHLMIAKTEEGNITSKIGEYLEGVVSAEKIEECAKTLVTKHLQFIRAIDNLPDDNNVQNKERDIEEDFIIPVLVIIAHEK